MNDPIILPTYSASNQKIGIQVIWDQWISNHAKQILHSAEISKRWFEWDLKKTNKHTKFFQKLEEKKTKIDSEKRLLYSALNCGQGLKLSEALCTIGLLVGISIWWMNNVLTPLLLFHFNKPHFFV